MVKDIIVDVFFLELARLSRVASDAERRTARLKRRLLEGHRGSAEYRKRLEAAGNSSPTSWRVRCNACVNNCR
jgi:hypothetical protein